MLCVCSFNALSISIAVWTFAPGFFSRRSFIASLRVFFFSLFLSCHLYLLRVKFSLSRLEVCVKKKDTRFHSSNFIVRKISIQKMQRQVKYQMETKRREFACRKGKTEVKKKKGSSSMWLLCIPLNFWISSIIEYFWNDSMHTA